MRVLPSSIGRPVERAEVHPVGRLLAHHAGSIWRVVESGGAHHDYRLLCVHGAGGEAEGMEQWFHAEYLKRDGWRIYTSDAQLVQQAIELLAPLDTPGPVTAVRDVLGQLEDLKASCERSAQEGERMSANAKPKRSAVFTRSDIEGAAEGFITRALEALDLIWQPEEITAEALALTDRTFGWMYEI